MAKRRANKATKSQGGAPEPHSFENLQPSLSEGVLKYVKEMKFTRMTPVQEATIPQLMSRKDVAVQAVTGSGKSLAFLIPVVEYLQKASLKRQQIGALILSPTRELALQTHSVAKSLCEACGMTEPLLLVGGSSSGKSSAGSYRPVTVDLQNFQRTGSDFVIGTPGRVEDVLTKYAVLDTSELEMLILDEADVLLNMGFAQTLQSILGKLPKMRRTGLFSATTSSSINASLKEWMHRVGMRNPVWIDVAVTGKQHTNEKEKLIEAQQATPSSLTNYYLVTRLDEKLSRLATFLTDHRDEKLIVFFLTCAEVEYYGLLLQRLLPDNHVEMLHGRLVQKRREKTLERFRGETNDTKSGLALFCTDVGARGIDVSDVDWVIQFDAPQDPAFFVHRVGRSARAGRSGSSLIFLTHKEEAYIELLQMKKVPLQPLPPSERCCPPETDYTKPCKDSERVVMSAATPYTPLKDLLPRVRELVLKDRDLLEKGTRAFTSFIRAYKQHHCSFIFRFASLDLGLLATAFCLLKLPKMPELKEVLQKHNGRLPYFTPAGKDVNIFAIPFKDKVREKARQKRIEADQTAGGKNSKLLKAEQKLAEKERKVKERREAAVAKGRNPDKKRGRQAQLHDEWDDLAKEERLYRKLKRGKITQEEYDQEMFGE